MEGEVKEKRQEMIERLAEVDDQIAELFLGEEEVPIEVLIDSIRRQTIGLKFVPVFMGSAFKNKGVQKLLDGVLAYLPNPSEVPNYALDRKQGTCRRSSLLSSPQSPSFLPPCFTSFESLIDFPLPPLPPSSTPHPHNRRGQGARALRRGPACRRPGLQARGRKIWAADVHACVPGGNQTRRVVV